MAIEAWWLGGTPGMIRGRRQTVKAGAWYVRRPMDSLHAHRARRDELLRIYRQAKVIAVVGASDHPADFAAGPDR